MTHSRQNAIETVTAYFNDGRFQSELADLVAFETESQNPDQAPELKRYLEQAILPRLTAMGFACTVHANPVPGGGPLILGHRHESDALPTVLTYGHGDVILAQTEQWREGLHPFRLIEQGDRLYGRGSADNKVQHLVNIAAMEAVIATRGALGFNAKVLIEMSEEIGSTGLAEFCAQNAKALAADVLIASDGPRLQPDTPTMFMGSRGAINFDLLVDLREGAHHSGNWGGLLADPAIILAQALSTITDPRGQIQIPQWLPNSLTDDIRAALDGLPIEVESGPAVDHDWGDETLSPAERAYGWNSFAILAMKSGVPDAPVNAISGHAKATCQLRYVVGTDVDQILPALREHLDANGFEKVQVLPYEAGRFAATRLSPNHPWAVQVANSLRETSGGDLHILPNLAGSIPNDVFADTLGLPTIWVPHSYRGCSQHAPDEHVLKSVCLDSLQSMAGVFWDIGAQARDM